MEQVRELSDGRIVGLVKGPTDESKPHCVRKRGGLVSRSTPIFGGKQSSPDAINALRKKLRVVGGLDLDGMGLDCRCYW